MRQGSDSKIAIS